MNIIILGDKFKKGMKSKGCVGLIKINKTDTILHKQYKQLSSDHSIINNIVYVGGFEFKKLSAFLNKESNILSNIKLIYNNSFDKKNTAFSLYLANEFLEDECLILDGSLVVTNNLIQTLKNNESCIVVGNSSGSIGCIINNTHVDNLSPDLDNKIYDIYHLSKQSAQKLKNIINNNNYHNYFLFELINLLIDQGEIFSYLKLKKSQLCYQ